MKPVAPSAGAPAKNTLEDIVTNTFRTFVQVIIQARSQRLGGHDPAPSSSPHHRPDVYSPEASTWVRAPRWLLAFLSFLFFFPVEGGLTSWALVRS